MNVIEQNLDAPGYGLMKAVILEEGKILDLNETNRLPEIISGYPEDRWAVRLLGQFKDFQVYLTGWIHPEYFLAVTDKSGRVIWMGSHNKDSALFWNGDGFETSPVWGEWTDKWTQVTRFSDEGISVAGSS
jgi:hypothetical protein